MSRLLKKAGPPIRMRSVTKRVTESERSTREPEPRVEIVEGNPPPFDGPRGLRLLRFQRSESAPDFHDRRSGDWSSAVPFQSIDASPRTPWRGSKARS
jgi:hypothetical protein